MLVLVVVDGGRVLAVTARSVDLVTISRDEFMLLRDEVRAVSTRVDLIDQTGSRGVAVLAVQVSELSKDVGAVKTDIEGHRGEHQQDARARVTGRRWLIATFVAAVAAVDGPLVTILLARH